jgi:hypothetical protein
MLRPTSRAALVGVALALMMGAPSNAKAQVYTFDSCSDPGICGWVNAFFTGSLLTVRVQNSDNVLGSALWKAHLIFTDAIAPGSVGDNFDAASVATRVGPGSTLGAIPPGGGWSFGAIGGTFQLDLASFFDVFIEGSAASPYRGDGVGGEWVTTGDGYVEFVGDMTGIPGVVGNRVRALGFCTDVGCVEGAAGEQAVVPEPATMTLLATGIAGLAGVARRRRRNTA